jgi:hypothetical protein
VFNWLTIDMFEKTVKYGTAAVVFGVFVACLAILFHNHKRR